MFETGPSHAALYCQFLPGVENSKLPFEEKRLSNRDKKPYFCRTIAQQKLGHLGSLQGK